ncbi:MAG: hypothetical protein NVS2B14_01610 [Chamaesiphon sp.]
MSRTQTPVLPTLKAEVSRLNSELQIRDELVQQLSHELFRLVKGNAPLMLKQQVPEPHLREQLQKVEQHVAFYQEQMSARDAEINQLRQSVQELTKQNRMLEQVVQELPQVYRQKFAERMVLVKEKVAMLQRENRQLHAELQSVSYRLAVRTRNTTQIDLPNFPPRASGSTSKFGSK